MLRCIIVEDDPGSQHYLKFLLERIGGIKVIGVYGNTVQAALNVEKLKPDFILLDINISGLDGPEFVELLDYQPKIIVITAHNEEYLKTNYDINYQFFIQKPIDEELLKKAIDTIKA
mgnify:CR=1 FL=1